jgi:hypothetical protein
MGRGFKSAQSGFLTALKIDLSDEDFGKLAKGA